MDARTGGGAGGAGATFAFGTHLFSFTFALLFLSRGRDPGCFPQLRETQLQKIFQTPQIRRCMHISAEPEIHRAVVSSEWRS